MSSKIPSVHYKFERIEKKFWMSRKQYHELLPLLEKKMNHDEYGIVTICNIFYDTPDYALIRRSIERPYFKEKLRLRSYGLPTDADMVFVEIKRKLDGIGYKRRIQVPFYQAKNLLQGKPIGCENAQIEKEILAFVNRYHPEPMVYLSYQRYAMTAKDNPDFRVTIDQNLQYRMDDVENPDETQMQPIMDDKTMVLMEIKALGAIPMWLTDELSRLKIYQAPFSKIGTCYTQRIAQICTY